MADNDNPKPAPDPMWAACARIVTDVWDGVTRPVRDLYEVPQAYLRSLVSSPGDTILATLGTAIAVIFIALCCFHIHGCAKEVSHSKCRIESYTVDMQAPSFHVTRMQMYRVVGIRKYHTDLVLADRLDGLDEAVAAAGKLGCPITP